MEQTKLQTLIPAMKPKYFLLLSFLVVFISCKNGNVNPSMTDTISKGHINIGVDPSLLPLMQAEVAAYQHLYPNAQIDINQYNEPDAFAALMNDSVRVIISQREPTEVEKDYFKKIKVTLKSNLYALDAVAFIVNPSRPDTISPAMLQDILTGKITDWSQVYSKEKKGKINLVFDGAQSGSYQFVKNKVGGKLSENSFAAKSNSDVIDYVSKNPDALGMIGLNWISDKDDTLYNSFISKIKVMGLGEVDPISKETYYYKPFQLAMRSGKYPYTRLLYLISRETHTGLGTGFVSFACSDGGQRVVNLMGLLPTRLIQRQITIKTE